MKRFFCTTISVSMHLWFYVVMFLFVVALAPFLMFCLILGKRGYYYFYWLARNIWARGALYGLGVFPKIKFDVDLNLNKSHVFVANHSSMIDVLVMYLISKTPFVFIGKAELARYPLFGYFYRRVSILVDRKDMSSRSKAYVEANNLLKSGISICLFPEGGVPPNDVVLAPFKDGAFRMAIENKLPVVPVTLFDNKNIFPYDFYKGRPGIVRARVHAIIETKDMTLEDKRNLSQLVRSKILKDIETKVLSKR